jgi:hypothetical protein
VNRQQKGVTKNQYSTLKKLIEEKYNNTVNCEIVRATNLPLGEWAIEWEYTGQGGSISKCEVNELIDEFISGFYEGVREG